MLRFALPPFSGISSLRIEDIDIKESEYPIWIKEGQYDIFLLYSDCDQDEALNFADFLKNYMGRRVCLLDDYRSVEWKRTKFNALEAAVSRSLFTFIYVTQKFVDDKKWGEYKQNATLAYSIEHEQDHVIPVNTDPTNIRMPFALNPLRSVNVGRIHYHFKPEYYYSVEPQESTLNNSSASSEDSPVHALSVLKAQIERLIGTKEEQKKQRDEMKEKELEEWLSDERLRRFQEKCNALVEREQRKKMEKIKVEEMQKDALQRARQPVAAGLHPSAEQASPRITQTSAPQHSIGEAINMLRQMGVHDKADVIEATVKGLPQQGANITINLGPQQHTVINSPSMKNVQIGERNKMEGSQCEQEADSGRTSSGEFSADDSIASGRMEEHFG